MAAYQNVLVFGEMDRGRLSALTLELLGIGAKLAADLGQSLHLVHLGADTPTVLGEAYGYGAQEVHAAADPSLGVYEPELYLQAMEQIVGRLQPRVILFGQTDKGLDLAPRLAFRLRTGATLDCTDLSIDKATDLLDQMKPVFGGKAQGTYRCHAFPQIATVRQGSFPPAAAKPSERSAATPAEIVLDASRARTRSIKKVQDEDLALAVNLAGASVVVSGGRGLKGGEGVALISKTAELLGGAVAGTRAAIESGWLPRAVLVGLTGLRVNPQLYMAVGVSGALHHMAGCMRSKTIVGINTDEAAPIFKFSHIGVVGDYRDVLEGFNEEVSRIRSDA